MVGFIWIATLILTTPDSQRDLSKEASYSDGIQSSIVSPATNTPTDKPHAIYFNIIDGHLIGEVALKTEGSFGSSGLYAAACVYVHHLNWHLQICVKLFQTLLDVSVPPMLIPTVFQHLLPAALSL